MNKPMPDSSPFESVLSGLFLYVRKLPAAQRSLAAVLLVIFLSACDGDPRPFEEAVLANQLQLVSLTIEPAGADVNDLFVNPGRQLQFSVSGISSSNLPLTIDNENRRWSSSAPSVGSINSSGFFTALADGVTTVSVRIGGVDSEPFVVNVSNASLQAITEIQGAQVVSLCSAETYTAIGTFSDGSLRTLRELSWALDPLQAGAEAGNGLSQATGEQVDVLARVPGVFSLVATQDGFSLPLPITVEDDLQSVRIEGVPAELSNNETVSLSALAVTISNEATITTRDVTDIVLWRISANAAIAEITSGVNGGELTGLIGGSGFVEAVCGSSMASAPLIVNEDNFFGFTVSPADAQTISIGQTLEFTASATADGEADAEDVTERVDWSISDDDVADLEVDGDEVEVTGRRSGVATLVARFGNNQLEIVITVQ